MAEKKTHEYFVGIDAPVEIRRELLESSRYIIRMLQSHERIRILRRDKNVELQKLDTVMKDIYALANKVKGELPKISPKKKQLEKPQKKVVPDKKVIAKKESATKAEVVPRERSALDLLEEELLNVEKQLNEMK
jgi:hypothetical protein